MKYNMEDKTNTANKMPKPLLIYDGNCDFCFYWASYWQKLTGDSVTYKPYQEVASQFPTISVEAFQHAVQYVAPDGKISSAAEASFLTLSNAPRKSFLLTLYRKLPGFAAISEKTYAFIASHRNFFYSISLLLWGRNYEPPRYDLITWLFLRILGLIFFAAFVSFGVQALGLIGSQGIAPVSDLITAAQNQLGAIRYWLLPMVFWLNSSDIAIQATCWIGAALSLLLVFNIRPRICLFLLYVLYLSLVTAGQVFMTFQWDTYLLETGILAIILVGSHTLGIWLLRWLLFRFIFIAGFVKIFSGDSTWQNLSALSYYFQTEPLPTPLAWYAHHLPQSILTMATAIALFIEIVIPFLIFFPRKLRFIAAYAIMFMQTLILLTGNYNFFNFLTIALCLTLFDDAAIKHILPRRLCNVLQKLSSHVSSNKIISLLTGVFATFLVFISVVELKIKLTGNAPAPFVWIYSIAAPFDLVNVYGPFAVITTERMEIVIEGSNDGINWSEYNFKYKPGDVNRALSWNIPHQPRLDWQMWFAALGSSEDNPWFSHLLQRILENSPTVIALLDGNPFPDKPPLYIRAQFYEYRFTDSNEKEVSGAWWNRRLVKLYFLESHL